MSIRKEIDDMYTVWHCQRHPITRVPKMLRLTKIKSLAEAKRAEQKLIIKINKSFEKAVSPPWKNVIEEYLINCRERGLTIRTVENSGMCLKAYTLKDWGEESVSNISTSQIRSIIELKAAQKSASQKKNILKYIRLCLEFAVESGYLERNPTPKMKFRIGDKVKKVLTESQVKILLEKSKFMDVEWYPIWVTAVYTGMRNGELYALTWDKVNLDERKIVVDCSWDKKAGLKSTKSGDERVVEIAPGLLPILRELKIQLSRESIYVLPRIDKWDKGEQARELRMFLAGLGLPQIRFHDLRATWATIMLGKGIAAIKVMRMGGWRDMKTMQYYMRMAGIDIKGITDELCLHSHNDEPATVLSFS